MSRSAQAWLVIAAVGVGTYAIRASFLLVAHRFTGLSETTRAVLRMIPAAALSALVAPALLRPDGAFDPLSPELLAGVVALVVAAWSRSILATIAVGLAGVVAFGYLPLP